MGIDRLPVTLTCLDNITVFVVVDVVFVADDDVVDVVDVDAVVVDVVVDDDDVVDTLFVDAFVAMVSSFIVYIARC